ncbi:DUF3592 domain-containing protein [Halorussus marinus]|uniref:DUF3592 domain-containing protein n=1 Tax=Halorussus marinus TaxID=2505976 RepID=UPI00109224B5|nr:DUF3592 domain-containing protein [Halorussus marinus]
MAPDSSITVGGREIDPVRGGLLVLLVGVAVAGYGGYDHLQQRQAIDAAVPVNATITETGVESDGSGSSTGVDHYPVVRFEYAYRGESYTSQNVYPASVRQSYDTESAASDVVDEYEVGATVTAYATPESPGDAFLKNQQSNGPLVAIGIGLVAMLLGGRSALNGFRNS